ncbi:MAG: hypothetical protein HZA54_03880 [Planctomycetes bacterium]|nr:hypothetical protein [Planctomycetota bacterium]
MDLAKIVGEVGQRFGLKAIADKPIVYGERGGCLVQLSVGARPDGNPSIIEQIRFGDAARDAEVQAALRASVPVKEKGVTAKEVKVEGGIATFHRVKGLLATLNADTVAAEFEALLGVVRGATPSVGSKCRVCKGETGDAPLLLNGVVDRVCERCLFRMKHEAESARQAYDLQPTNLLLGAVIGAVLALVGALVWAGVTVGTNRMFWLIAIGIGYAVGLGTTKASGKGGRPVQVLGGVLTIGGVLLGQVFVLAHAVREAANQRGVEIAWGGFLTELPGLLGATGEDTLFALGGGAIGAIYAAGAGSAPTFELTVER